jgi:uncharacterized protein YjdB
MKKRGAVIVTAVFLLVLSVNAYAQTEVFYSSHVAEAGWLGYVMDGETSGTTGQSRQIEAVKMRVSSGIKGGIRYNTYVRNLGWIGWSFDNEESGAAGQSTGPKKDWKWIEAIRIQLTGDLAKRYDILYRVYAADIGWLGWVQNGEDAGTTGQSRRIEAYQVKLVEK